MVPDEKRSGAAENQEPLISIAHYEKIIQSLFIVGFHQDLSLNF